MSFYRQKNLIWLYFPCSIAHPSFVSQSIYIQYLCKSAFLCGVVVVGYFFKEKCMYSKLKAVWDWKILLIRQASFWLVPFFVVVVDGDIFWGCFVWLIFLKSRPRNKRFNSERLGKKLVSYQIIKAVYTHGLYF